MAKKEITITVKPGRLKFPTLAFYLYGQDYLDYAVAAKKPHDRYSPVPYFLYCQSIELLLKSYLSAYGFAREKLRRKFGHDLERLLTVAKEHNLDNVFRSTPQRRLAIRKANSFYREKANKQFNYLSYKTLTTSNSELPDIRILEGTALRLARITHSIIYGTL